MKISVDVAYSLVFVLLVSVCHYLLKKLILIACDLCEISLLYEISKAKYELLIFAGSK